mgnify:CR=1 FL=1
MTENTNDTTLKYIVQKLNAHKNGNGWYSSFCPYCMNPEPAFQMNEKKFICIHCEQEGTLNDLKEFIMYTGSNNLVKMDENRFAYRPLYKSDWKVIPRNKVEAAFNTHFPEQEFDIEKAAIAVNLEALDILF